MYEILHRLGWADGAIAMGVVLILTGMSISYLDSNRPEVKVEIVKKPKTEEVRVLGVSLVPTIKPTILEKQKPTIREADKLIESDSSKININTASTDDLDTLSGIGPALAKRIIEYRERNNGYRSVEEIKLVSGIGEKLYEKIKDRLSI